VDVIYTTASNSLDVDAENIKVLHIDCRSMYEDECQKVFGFDPSENSNYYKWYFIEKDHLNINIDSDSEIKELSFIDTPLPNKVVVNGVPIKEGIDYFYTDNFSTALSQVPYGHTNVDIYFKSTDTTPPNAILYASKTVVGIDESILFDGSTSFDTDGNIMTHILDFGDGTFRSASNYIYSYSEPGVYGVVLTVRDNDYLMDHAFINITVLPSTDTPEIQGTVPSQVKAEDSPPWTLELTQYEPIAQTEGVVFSWYVTGENDSLYTVVGENSSDDTLIFSPIANAYGTDNVKLWLESSEGVKTSQQIWINITPVNDPPTIFGVPDLIVHYEDPYTFNYRPYVNDIETPVDELVLEIFDGLNEEYITIHGLNATFNYPQSMVSEVIYATITVSDSNDSAQAVISIGITSDHVPELVKTLPDILIYEGTTKYNIFDLDDYFTDPDNDAIYFSYGQSHVDIKINDNHSVDITAESEWTGSELVTFRARDPVGALAEDTIVVTIIPVNDPPSISGVPNLYVRYDHDYKFDLTPYIFDNDNKISELMINVSDPEHIRLDIRNNLVIIFNYPIEMLGQSVVVRLSVSDGLDSSFQDINVKITDDFPPELLNPLPDIVFLEDEPYLNAIDLNNYFLDVDGDVLYYTTGNNKVKITIHDDELVDFSAPKNWFGSESVYFRASDPSGALQEDLIDVTVLPINDPPAIWSIPTLKINESEREIVDLRPYIHDVDNNISELEIIVENDYVVVSGSTLVILGSPDLPDHIEVIVTDGEFKVSQSVDIKLKLKEPPNSPTFWDLFTQLLPFLLMIMIIILTVALLVYQKKSKYLVEEVFLIHKGGTLINHLMSHSRANVDEVIFSGMFTAVQEFIKDTFVKKGTDTEADDGKNWLLDELKLGQNKILIERSDNAYLAVIFSGEGSKPLRRLMNKLLKKIETKYADILPTWDGDIRALSETKHVLSVLIKNYDYEKSKEINLKNKSKSEKIGSTSGVKTQVSQTSNKQISTAKPVENKRGPFNQSKSVPIQPNNTAPTGLDVSTKKRPVTIKSLDGGKEFEIDPSRSILMQLAELEEKGSKSEL
jgi:hypothetical protein